MVFNNRIKEVQKLVYDGFNVVFNHKIVIITVVASKLL